MNPYRFLNMSAQEIIDCDIGECCIRQIKVNDALEVYDR